MVGNQEKNNWNEATKKYKPHLSLFVTMATVYTESLVVLDPNTSPSYVHL